MNYDDPEIEAQWLYEQRENVKKYLDREKVAHRVIAKEPSWFVTPYVSIWAVKSMVSEGSVGFWVISGDLPTDYLSGNEACDAREAMKAFSKRWFEVSSYLLKGKQHPRISIGTEKKRKELGGLLRKRAKTLLDWSEDDGIWDKT